MIRIIAGKNRTRKLEQPPLEITRPTSDRAREAIFSIINKKIEGAVVLDLFSGTGAFAFESLSRGAAKAIAVEKNIKAISVIKENSRQLGEKNISIISSDVIAYLKNIKGLKFDFIFLDPPYENKKIYEETLDLLQKNNNLNNMGYIVCETDNPYEIRLPKGFVIQKNKKYGKANILLIVNNI